MSQNKASQVVGTKVPSSLFLRQIFEMMDAKARQDCIKEIDLLKVRILPWLYLGDDLTLCQIQFDVSVKLNLIICV